MNQLKYRVIGLMSGTSLDGLDVALIDFDQTQNKWNYDILSATTIKYSNHWHSALKNAHNLSHQSLQNLSSDYGIWLGEQVNAFVKKNGGLHVDFISSHGHTIHHQPKKKLTMQIGNGPELFKVTGLPVVCDFRVQDILLGGEGAPLVPIGDELLFSRFGACINLGGFANISLKTDSRIAFDICPVNIVLNELSNRMGHDFDKNGDLARKGVVLSNLLEQLNALPFYKIAPPKSLGREWVEEQIFPLLKSEFDTIDLLRTFTEHIAMQISHICKKKTGNKTFLVTGGGSFNGYLIERLGKLSGPDFTFVLPEDNLINYKEALIFGLLGLLRWTNQPNCLKSVTGAICNHSSGRIYR